MSYSEEDIDIEIRPKKRPQNIEPAAVPAFEEPARDLQLIKEIDAFAEELAETRAKELENDNQIMSHDMLKAKLKEEYKELFLMKELKKELDDAVALLKEEMHHYLEPDACERLVSEFKQAAIELKKPLDEENKDKTPQEIGKISQETMNSIENVAKKKHEEKDYGSSTLLYIFLSAINPRSFVYWLRLGVSYQKQKEYKKALFAYENAKRCNNASIVNNLFIAECQYYLGEKEKALDALNTAKELASEQTPGDNEMNYIASLEKLL